MHSVCLSVIQGCIQIMESHGIRSRCWKVVEDKPNGCCILDPCTCVRPSHTLSTLSLPTLMFCTINCIFCLWIWFIYSCQLKHVSLPYTQDNWFSKCIWKSDLFDVHSIKQSWKDRENGHKWSWKVLVNHWSVFTRYSNMVIWLWWNFIMQSSCRLHWRLSLLSVCLSHVGSQLKN